MTTEQLLAKAVAAKKPSKGRICMDKFMPIVDTLRRKNWNYRDIYDFLKSEGEEVQARPNSFIAAASKRYRHWLKQLHKEVFSK